MADKARNITDKQLRKMERHIQSVYKEAENNIREKWDEYMQNAEKRLKSLEIAYVKAKQSGDKAAAKKAGETLGKAKANITYRNQYFRDMVDETTTRLANANKIALAYMNGQLPSIYAVNYNQLAGEADKVGIKFNIVNENVVKNLVTQKEIKLTYKGLNIAKDKRWNARQINASVLQGILQGESMEKIAKRLTLVIDNNEQAAIRNARTLVTGTENQGRQDSYEDLQERGAVIKKAWIATPDGRTRQWHLSMDGQEVDVDEDFIDGEGNKLAFPGDPNAAPETVYNCRCSMRTHIIGFRTADGRIEKVNAERKSGLHQEQIAEERKARG